MVECNAILKYLTYYYYDEKDEKIIIKLDQDSEAAAKEYNRVRRKTWIAR